jgi:mannose-6-phosphate isomerase-like protein (cupin superfamily)
VGGAAQAHPGPSDYRAVSTPAAAQLTGVAACHLVSFPKVTDPRGNLSFVEGDRHVPFQIRRVYWLYDVPGGAERGGHAHHDTHEVLVAMSGSFDVVLSDGAITQRFHLNRSYAGLYVPAMVWRELDNFSSGSVCMVLASEPYAEADYVRERASYVQAVREP